MRTFLLFISAFFIAGELQSQTCASAYDTNFNNDYTPTHYFPGPMAIPFNTDITGRIDTGTDRDYYKFTVTNGGTITLTLTKLPANYNLSLVNSNGTTLVRSTRTGTSNETINFTATSNTVYYAFVYPANTRTFNAGACYTLRVATGTASRPAPVFSEDMDVYPNPAVNQTNLVIPEVKGVMQVRVINSLGNVVLRQNTAQKITPLQLSGLRPGMYIVDVFSSDGKTIYRKKLMKNQ
jgi:hypothetical protein